MSIFLLFFVHYAYCCPTSLPITITSLAWSPESPSVGWGARAIISGNSANEAWIDVNSCQIDIATQVGTVSTGLFPCFYGVEQQGRDVKISTGVWRLPGEIGEGEYEAEVRLIDSKEQLIGCFQAPITLQTPSKPSNCTANPALTFSYLTWVSTASAFSLLLEGSNTSNADLDLSSCLLTWTSGFLPFPCYAGVVPQGALFRVQSDNIAFPANSTGKTGVLSGLSAAGDTVACWPLSSLSP